MCPFKTKHHRLRARYDDLLWPDVYWPNRSDAARVSVEHVCDNLAKPGHRASQTLTKYRLLFARKVEDL
ncbi:MAG: hypothetical protein WCE40_15225 [Polyangia bacterium]